MWMPCAGGIDLACALHDVGKGLELLMLGSRSRRVPCVMFVPTTDWTGLDA
jgi:hypothetical protein